MTTATLESAMTETPVRLTYEAPGPGVWSRDVDHQSAPRGVLMQELFAPNFAAGFSECFSRYGMPLDRLEGAHVHGWWFFRAVPAGVPDTGKAPPPAPVLKVLVRLAPELRRRRRVAAAAIADALWLADARRWAEERTEWTSRTEELLSVDLASIDDEALAEQVRLALALSGGMIRRHFSLVGPSVAVGRLISAAPRLGLSADEIVPALRGSSPSSAASRGPLVELAALTAGRHDVRTAEQLRAVSPRASALVDQYLSGFGWRPLAADIEAPTLAELPDRLVDLVRSQAAVAAPTLRTDRFGVLRERVPHADRAEFDTLVDEARECYASLDDNSGIVASTFGVVRRVVLEVGRRAELRGALIRRDDAFNHTSAELLALAVGDSPVTALELDERREQRIHAAQEPPPHAIGGVPQPPPDPSIFPGALGELATAVGIYLDLKFSAHPDAPRPAMTGTLTVAGQGIVGGVSVVAGTVAGRIVVSMDPSDALERIEPGDILVCPYTTAAHNSIFPMLGGVLTQFGGPLGHTAVMAREFNIPAVVGAGSLPLHLDGRHGELFAEL
jgi:phosphohistidine swiveling domain-containing protein